jgi:mycoredoxin
VSRRVFLGMNDTEPVLEVFWRPGCGSCASLRRSLHEAGVDARWRNIWDDPPAAAFVRSVADGNETVPTVTFDDRVFVAPRPTLLLADLRVAHPELDLDSARPWPLLRMLQWAGVIVGLIASEALAQTGQTALSWALDAVIVAFFLVVRRLRAGWPSTR